MTSQYTYVSPPSAALSKYLISIPHSNEHRLRNIAIGPGNKLPGVMEQFATQFWANATQ